MKPGMLIVKRSVKETRNPRNLEEKLFLGFVDICFAKNNRKDFQKVWSKHFKTYPLDRDLITYSGQAETIIVSLYLKELPVNNVESFFKSLEAVFNVVEG